MMKTRRIGDCPVTAIGLGTAGFGLALIPEADSIRVIHAALDAGVRLIVTAACYVPSADDQGYGERVIAKALKRYAGDADGVIVATKGGHKRISGQGVHAAMGHDFILCGRPDFIREQCEVSLAALGTDAIDLYKLHWPDPNPDVPFLESVRALKDLQDEGKVRMIGLSNVSAQQIEAAREIARIAAVENPFSPGNRRYADVVRYCDAHAIAFMAYSPLGGGQNAKALAQNTVFAAIALEHGVSAQQVALAWSLAQADVVIPIPGAHRPASITDNAKAPELELSETDLKRLTLAIDAAEVHVVSGPDVRQRVRQKTARVFDLAPTWLREAYDDQVITLLRQGKAAEAEAALDEALGVLEPAAQ